MAEEVQVNLKHDPYVIYISDSYKEVVLSLQKISNVSKVAIITDSNVELYQSSELIQTLEAGGFVVHKYAFKAGEKSKNLRTAEDIYRFLMGLKFDRNSVLIALGGGVVGDITGFVAATYLRGIRFVQVPTSLLAQADSSVGGKVGVDFEGAKNLIGTFYQPQFVHINASSLKTLPKRELSAGLAEIIKHGIIRDRKFFCYVNDNMQKIFNLDIEVLKQLAKTNCTIKGNVVAEDEKETTGAREILNFGHTIGHAIESAMDFSLLHGECVSLGIIGAYKLALMMRLTTDDEFLQVKSTLKLAGLPIDLPNIDVEKVYKHMLLDKKAKDGRIKFILPTTFGKVQMCFIDDEQMVKRAISLLACSD